MRSPTIKPCPFCGGEAEFFAGGDEYELWAKVECSDCNACIVESSDYLDRNTDALIDEAVAAWNKRAVDPAAIIKAGHGMKKCLEELIETFGVFYDDGVLDYGCAMANIRGIKRAIAAWNLRAETKGKETK